MRALANCITGLYVEKVFGRTEYIYQINQLNEAICEYESTVGPIILQSKTTGRSGNDAKNNITNNLGNSGGGGGGGGSSSNGGAVASGGVSNNELHFDSSCAYSCSPAHVEMINKKGQYVLRTLQLKLGSDAFLKVRFFDSTFIFKSGYMRILGSQSNSQCFK